MENKEFFEKREENFFEGDDSFCLLSCENEGKHDLTGQSFAE